jgi:hypothetical protein
MRTFLFFLAEIMNEKEQESEQQETEDVASTDNDISGG